MLKAFILTNINRVLKKQHFINLNNTNFLDVSFEVRNLTPWGGRKP